MRTDHAGVCVSAHCSIGCERLLTRWEGVDAWDFTVVGPQHYSITQQDSAETAYTGLYRQQQAGRVQTHVRRVSGPPCQVGLLSAQRSLSWQLLSRSIFLIELYRLCHTTNSRRARTVAT